jgi:hypothetical protein
MIQANELRIGNYLFDSLEDSGVIQITEIKQMTPNKIGNMSISYYGVNGGYCTTSLEENITDNEIEDYFIQPIPLTEEWLIKLGFVDGSYLYKNYKIKAGDYWNSIKFYEGEWCYNNDDSDAGCYFLTTIKYVHQLQNLYFALTNEELTFKP